MTIATLRRRRSRTRSTGCVRSIRLGLLALLLAQSVSADTYPKNHSLDVENYRFELTLFDQESRIEGRTTIDVRIVGDDADEIVFDLVNQPEGSTDGGMLVASVTVDGNAVEFAHADSRLTVPLSTGAAGRAIGSTVSIEIEYAGTPKDALGIGPNKHGTWSWFSDNWPNKARHWLPTVDHPYDKATSEMVVTAPSRYQVVSNGLLIEESDLIGDRRLSHWRQSVPIATWLYTLGVTEFAVQNLRAFDGKPVQTWVFAEDRDAGFYDFAVPTHHVLEFYSDFVGPYSYEKLANVVSARTKGGMESATAIMYDDRSVTGERSERWRNVVIHEIAHQWFGNAVTAADWDDVWLSEGFATYFTLLFIEHAYGREEFVEGLRSSRDRVMAFYDENPGYRLVHANLNDMSKVTTGNTYQKGAWTLHMLRSMIGDEAFWRGIQSHYALYRDQNCTTADFRREMEKASGQPLQWFFDQWLRRGGALVLEWDQGYDAATKTQWIELTQTQTEAPFKVSIPVEIVTPARGEEPRSVRREVALLEDRTQRFEFSAEGAPSSITIDPDVEVLMRLQPHAKRD